MCKECEDLLLEFELCEEGRPIPPDLMKRMKEHAKSCTYCSEMILLKYAERVAEESSAIPSTWDLEAGWQRLQQSMLLSTSEESSTEDDVSRQSFPAKNSKYRVIALAASALGIAAVLAFILWPRLPGTRIVAQTWSCGGVSRSAWDPEILNGADPIDLSMIVGGKTSEHWMMGIILLKNNELLAVPLAPSAVPNEADALLWSIEVDKDFEVTVQPFVVEPPNLPTHLILLFTENKITEQLWRDNGPDEAQPGMNPSEVAKDIARQFDGSADLLPLR